MRCSSLCLCLYLYACGRPALDLNNEPEQTSSEGSGTAGNEPSDSDDPCPENTNCGDPPSDEASERMPEGDLPTERHCGPSEEKSEFAQLVVLPIDGDGNLIQVQGASLLGPISPDGFPRLDYPTCTTDEGYLYSSAFDEGLYVVDTYPGDPSNKERPLIIKNPFPIALEPGTVSTHELFLPQTNTIVPLPEFGWLGFPIDENLSISLDLDKGKLRFPFNVFDRYLAGTRIHQSNWPFEHIPETREKILAVWAFNPFIESTEEWPSEDTLPNIEVTFSKLIASSAPQRYGVYSHREYSTSTHLEGYAEIPEGEMRSNPIGVGRLNWLFVTDASNE